MRDRFQQSLTSLRPLRWIILALLWMAGLPACQPAVSAAPPVEQVTRTTAQPSQSSPTSTPPPDATQTVTPTPQPTSTPVWALSSPTPSPTPGQPACLQAGGSFVTGQLEVDLLPAPLDYRIYLPPCYTEQPARRYPVLYLIHGQSSTDDQWQRLGAGSTADALIVAGELPPFIIVMPRDRLWREPDQDSFGEAVIQSLLPYVDRNYRTIPLRQYRAVGGLSRGGAWAVHLGFAEWQLFGAVGIHSGFAFYSDTPFITGWLDEIPPDQMPRIYLDLGDNDRPAISESAQWFENILTERGIAHEYHLFTGYHEEAYWAAHLEEYLRWYAADW